MKAEYWVSYWDVANLITFKTVSNIFKYRLNKIWINKKVIYIKAIKWEVSSNKVARIWGMAKFAPHYCTLKIFTKRFF